MSYRPFAAVSPSLVIAAALALITTALALITSGVARADWPTERLTSYEGSAARLRGSTAALLPLARLVGLEREVSRARYLSSLDGLATRRGTHPDVTFAIARARAATEPELAAAAGRLAPHGVLCLTPFRVRFSGRLLEIPFGAPRGRIDTAAFIGHAASDVAIECAVDAPAGPAIVARRGSEEGYRVTLPGGPVWLRLPLTPKDDVPLALELRLMTVAGKGVAGKGLAGKAIAAGAPPAPTRVVVAVAASAASSDLRDWLAKGPSVARTRTLRSLGYEVTDPLPDAADLDEVFDAATLAPSDQALAALRTAPPSAAIELEIARRHQERAQSMLALDEARVLRKSEASPGAAALVEAAALADLGVLVDAQLLAESIVQASPDVPVARELLAGIYQRRSLSERAVAAWSDLGAITADDAAPSSEYELQKSLGHGDEARRLNAFLVARRPDAPSYRIERMRLLELLGDRAAADAVLAEASSLFPADPDIAEAVGSLYDDRGDRDAALLAYHHALDLRPHQPDLRAKVRRLEQARTDFAVPWALDPLSLDGVSEPVESLSEDGELLLNQRVLRLFPGGTSEAWQQIVFRAGKSTKSKTFSFDYDPSIHSVETLTADRLSAAGEPIGEGELDDLDASSDGNGLYYEQHTSRITFSELEPGELVVVEVLTSDFSRNLFGGMFADVTGLDWTEPCRRARVVYLVPDGLTLSVGLAEPPSGVAPLVRTDGRQGDYTSIAVERTGIPKMELEPSMPGYTEVAAYVHASSLPNWPAVGQWFSALSDEVIAPTPEVAVVAHHVGDGATTDDEKVRRAFDYVARSIRYVGLEFGVHGYKPYGVSATLERRFADCKDKASLLRAMLMVLGVPAEMVLVRTRPKGRLRDGAASPGGFDHAIIYLPTLDRFVDPTAAWQTAWELPSADQGASALVVEPGGGRRVELPIATPDRNRLAITFSLPTGKLNQLGGRIVATGSRAAELRERFAISATRDEELRQMLSSEYPGAVVVRTKVTAGFDAGPVSIDFVAMLPDAPFLAFVPASFSVRRRFASLAERHHPVEIEPFAWSRTLAIDVDAVKGALPPDLALTSPFGSAHRSVTTEGGRASISVDVTLTVDRVPLADYGAFRRFAADVDALLAPVARLELAR